MPARSPKLFASDTEIVGSKSEAALHREWTNWHAKNGSIEAPPKNAITALGYAKVAKITKGNAYAFLKYKADCRVLKTGMFRINVDGRLRLTRHWWQ
jgi:hypothetical protein